METNGAAPKPAAPSNKVVIAAAAVVVTAVVIVAVMLLNRDSLDNDNRVIGYADASVFLDEDSLQAAYDEASQNAANNSVALWYKNNAYSDDGIHFKCFIGNSSGNLYDMFLTIYSDLAMTDQIFLSELIRPGSGFEQIELERALEAGTNTVYVASTLVDTAEDGTQTIVSQVVHTMDFIVSE